MDEKDKSSVNIKEDYIVPTMGRYIRFSPSVSGTLRVWEFEAYGIDNVKMTIDVNSTELKVNSGDTKYIEVNYSLHPLPPAMPLAATMWKSVTLPRICRLISL